MNSNTEELKEIWKKPIPQDCWASVQRISQLIDADSLDYCIKRWKDESDILYNNSINDIIQSPSTLENPLMDNSLENNILDNLIGPYRKTELMLSLLCIKKRNLVEFRERIEKLLQLARQDSENDKLNKNFIGSIASAIKNYVTTPGGQYTCEIEKDDKCFEKGIKQVISSLPEYPKCHPPSLMYIRHKPEDVFLNNCKMNWKPEFSIPDEKSRIDILEKKIPGITATSPTSNKPPVKKEEKPSFLRRKPSYSFLRNSLNRPSMRQNNININKPLTGGSLLSKKSNVPRRNMVLDLEEVNRLNEEKRLALKREEEEKLAAEKEKERKKKEEMLRKQKEKEERERERMEKRKKKQKEVEEEKKRKEALKEAREKEAKEKEKKRQEAIAAAKEAKEKEAREKELRKQKEKEAKEKEKRERILQRENSVTSPIKRRTRKKRRVDNESGSSSINNSEATTPVLPLNNTLNDVPEMSNPPDQNNMYSPGMSDNDMNSYSNDYYNPNNNNMNPNQNLHDPNMMSSNNNNEPDNNININYYNPNQNSYYNQPPPNENHSNMNNNNNNLHPLNNNNNYDPNQPPPTNDSSPSYQMEMNDYSNILGSTNLLDDNQRKFIIDFLNGKKVAKPDENTRIIPLNCEVYEEDTLSIREIIEFEMNFQSGTWRKLKKIKKISKE